MMAFVFRQNVQRHPVNYPPVFFAWDDNFPAAAGLSPKKGSNPITWQTCVSSPCVCLQAHF